MSTPLEIERKYLIEYPDLAFLNSHPEVTKSEITQTYLIAPDGEERRVRMRKTGETVTYFYTRKRRVTAVTREESETVISEETYRAYLDWADPAKQPLRKTRYCLPHDGLIFEIDLYPFWDTQAVAEVELKGEDAPVRFPGEITVIREVTGEQAYKNSELAKKFT